MRYEITSYIDHEIGNGDPIIAYSPETDAITLGTGFTSFESIKKELERRVDVSDGQRFDIFGIDGHIEFGEE